MSTEAKILVEGNIKVLFKGAWVTEIPFDADEISIGVMDPENDIYPDINLRQYRLDGGDPYISRKHARFFRKDGKYVIQDVCNNNSTSVGTKVNVINGETTELKDGDRIFISESLAFRFITSGSASEKDEEQAKDETEAKSEAEEKSEAGAEAKDETEEKSEAGSEAKDETEEKSNDESEAKDETEEKSEAKDDAEEKSDDGSEAKDDESDESEAKDDDAEEKSDDESEAETGDNFYLEVEDQTLLFFKPRNSFSHIFELNANEWEKDKEDSLPSLHIGRRSTEDGIYPDIDLWKYFFNDGDEYIARKHARIYQKDNSLYFQDISGKGSTWYNFKDDEHRLLKSADDDASRELKEGDKIIISDSVVFVVRK